MQTINKAEALKRIASLEKETATLKEIINAPVNVFDFTTFEDICLHEGIDSIQCLPWKSPVNADEEHDNAVTKVRIITRFLNGNDYKPNYADKKEQKHYPVFEYDPSVSAFRFLNSNFGYTGARTSTGVRHVFKSEKLSTHFGKTFIGIINKIINY